MVYNNYMMNVIKIKFSYKFYVFFLVKTRGVTQFKVSESTKIINGKLERVTTKNLNMIFFTEI